MLRKTTTKDRRKKQKVRFYFAVLIFTIFVITFLGLILSDQKSTNAKDITSSTIRIRPSRCVGWENAGKAKDIDLLNSSSREDFSKINSAIFVNSPGILGSMGDGRIKGVQEQIVDDENTEAQSDELQSIEENENDLTNRNVVEYPQNTLDCSSFSIPEFMPKNTNIQNARAVFSLGADTYPENEDVVTLSYSLDGIIWETLDSFPLLEDVSNLSHGGHWSYPLPELPSLEYASNIQLRTQYHPIPAEQESIVFVDGMELHVDVEPKSKQLKEYPITKETVQLSKTDFKRSEYPAVTVETEKKSFFRFLGAEPKTRKVESVVVTDPQGSSIDEDYEVHKITQGEVTREKYVVDTQNFSKPGKYNIKVVIEQGGEIQEISLDFTWGVLVINTFKSAYRPSEIVKFGMGVLDNEGHTICDADLTLQVTNPFGEKTTLLTSNNSIARSPQCGPRSVTNVPDYSAEYVVQEKGDYHVELHAVTKAGAYTIDDAIHVQETVAFDITRIGAMRIFPEADYDMSLEIIPQEDYIGTFEEFVPASFDIFEVNENGEAIHISKDKQVIRWQVNWKTGNAYTLSYKYNPPDVSPELHLVGPATVGFFSEFRQWQIASDAVTPNGVLIYSDTSSASTKYRTLTYAASLGGETTDGLGLSTDADQEVLKRATTRKEFMAGQLHDDGKLVLRTFNGSTWATQKSLSGIVAATNTGKRAFDIAYERLSGKAMVVYADDPTTGKVYYCQYDGSGWGPLSSCVPTNGTNDIDLTDGITALTGVPRKIKLIQGKEGSNYIWLLVEDANADLYAIRWNGSSWDTNTDITASTSLSCDDSTVALSGMCFGLGVESLTNDAILFYTEATSFISRTFTTSWTDPTTRETLASNGNWIFVTSDTESDRLSIASGATGSDFRPMVWKEDGSTPGIVSGTVDTGAEAMNGNNIDGFWEKRAGDTTRQAIFVYTDRNLLYPSYQTATCTGAGCAFSGNTPVEAVNRCADDCDRLLLRGNPHGNDMILVAGDIDSDLGMWRWSGSAWALVQEDLTTAGALVDGTVNINHLQFSFWYEYYAYSAWSRNWRFSTNETENDPTTWLANENVAPTDLAQEDYIRLRMQLQETGGTAEAIARKKLQYVSATTCVDPDDCSSWTDVGNTSDTGDVWRFALSSETCVNCSDDTVITAPRLTDTSQNGTYISSKDAAAGSNMNYNASAITEIDYPLKAEDVAGGETYYFRIYDVTDNTINYRRQDTGTYTYPSISIVISGITVSGTAYTNETGTTLNSSGGAIKLVNSTTGDTFSDSNGTDGSGLWSITGVTDPSNGDDLTIWLDGAGELGTLVVKYGASCADSPSCAGLSIYQNRVIIRNEHTGSVTNQDLSDCDDDSGTNCNDLEDEIGFVSNLSGTYNLIVGDGRELHIWDNDTLDAGGTVATSVSGDASSTDGDLHIDGAGILTMGTNALSVGGDYTNEGTFNKTNPQTTTFTATAANHVITDGGENFDTVVFSNASGGWSFADSTIIDVDLTMTNGTLSGSNDITVNGGNVTGGGDIDLSAGGTFLLAGSGNFGGDTPWDFTSLTFGDGTSDSTTSTGSGGITISSVMTIANLQALDAKGKTWTLSGTTTPFVITGTLNDSTDTSTFQYTGNGATNIAASTAYNNLEILPGGNSVTHTMKVGTFTLTGNLTLGNGAYTSTVITAGGAENPTINVGGNLVICVGACTNDVTFTKSSNTFTLQPTGTKTWTDNNTSKQDLGTVSIASGASTPKIQLATAASATTIAIADGHELDLNDQDLDIGGGSLTTAGTTGIITCAGCLSGTTTIAGVGTLGGGSGAITFYNLTLSGTPTLSSDFSVQYNLTLPGSVTAGGTTITMTGNGATLVGGGSTLNNLTIDPSVGSGTITLSTSDLIVSGTLVVADTDSLSIDVNRALSHTGATLTLAGATGGTISGAGTLQFTNASGGPGTDGTISCIVRYNASSGDIASTTLDARTYNGQVEIYSETSAARTATFASGTYTLFGATSHLYVIAASGAGFDITLIGATNDPTINIGGDIDFTGTGGASEIITSGTNTWAVSGNVNFSDGIFTTEGTHTLEMNGTSKTITSNAQALVNFDVTGGSIATIDALNVNGTFDVTSGTFTQGTDVDLNVAGNFTLANGTTFNKATGVGIVRFDGDLSFQDSTAGLQDIGNVEIGTSPDTTNLASDFKANGLTVNIGDSFYTNGFEVDIGNGNLTIDGIFDAVDDVDVDETLITCASDVIINSSATFAQDQSTVRFDANVGTSNFITDGLFSLYNLEVDGGVDLIVEVEDPLDIDNNVTIQTGTLDVVLGEDNAIVLGGNWDNNDTFQARSGTVTFDATDADNIIEAGSSSFNNVTLSGTGGGNGTWIAQTDDATVAGTMNVNTGDTLNIDSGRTLTHTGATLTLDGTISDVGRLTYLSATTFPGTGIISSILRMDATNTSQSMAARTYAGAVEIYSNTASDRTVTVGAGTAVFSSTLNISKGGAGGLMLELNTNDPATTFSEAITIASGTTLSANSANALNINANYANSGTFTHNSGTVTLAGLSLQTLSGNMTNSTSSQFNNLTITNSSGTDPDSDPSVIFSADAETDASFTSETADTKLRFLQGGTYTFQSISFNGQGTGTRVTLRSSSAGTAWNLNVAGTRDVLNTDVKDSNACGQAPDIEAADGTNLNSEGNSCWMFVSITFTLGSNSVDLGTLDLGSIRCDSHTLQTISATAGGYSTEVYDDGNLRDNGNTVDDVGDGEVTIGQEEYGIGTTDSGQTIIQDLTPCAGTALATGLDITTKTVAGEAAGPVNETITVQYAASIDALTIAGSYSHIVTFVTTGLF